MIVQTPYGVSPSFDLTIGGALVDYQAINTLTVEMEAGHHDMLIIGISGLPTRAVTEYRNLGVRFTYGTGGNYRDGFTGYVAEVRPAAKTAAGLINHNPFQDVQIVCLGTSWTMRGNKSQLWYGEPVHEVARQLGEEYGLSVSAPETERLFDTFLQNGESDWQFLVRYAGMQGLSVSAHNTHLHVYDPTKAVGRGISLNRIITSRGSDNQSLHPGQITDFQAVFADRKADGEYRNEIVTVMDPSGSTYDVDTREVLGIPLTKDPLYTDRILETADTYAEAVAALTGRMNQEYDYTADVVCIGLAGCQPGGVVELDNYNADYDGLWHVLAVKHVISSGVFTSELSIARNVQEMSRVAQVPALRTVPGPVYVNGRWQTEKQRYETY